MIGYILLTAGYNIKKLHDKNTYSKIFTGGI